MSIFYAAELAPTLPALRASSSSSAPAASPARREGPGLGSLASKLLAAATAATLGGEHCWRASGWAAAAEAAAARGRPESKPEQRRRTLTPATKKDPTRVHRRHRMARVGSGSWLLRAVLSAALMDASVGREASDRFYLIIDAGSSGSRLRMYRGTDEHLEPVRPDPADSEAFETEPGLSAYANNTNQAGPSLQGLLDAAKKYVPEEVMASSRLWVKATAGMRILDPSVLRNVFAAVDMYLLDPSKNPFTFEASEVLGGEEEAVFAYLSINHLLGQVTTTCEHCAGILDMGGASMQIAYKPRGDILANEFSYYVDQRRQSVYAKSYLRFGIEEAILRLKKFMLHKDPTANEILFPCYNTGYSEDTRIDGRVVTFKGSGDTEECYATSKHLLHTDYECLLEPCPMMGVHMSSLEGHSFYAISGYFYVVAGLGLVGWNDTGVVTPSEIHAGTDALCQRNQTEALAHSGAPWKYLKGFCFAGHYIVHILKALGFPKDSRSLTFARLMPGGGRADWTLGAALFETQYMPLTLSSRAEPCRASGWSSMDGGEGKWQERAPSLRQSSRSQTSPAALPSAPSPSSNGSPTSASSPTSGPYVHGYIIRKLLGPQPKARLDAIGYSVFGCFVGMTAFLVIHYARNFARPEKWERVPASPQGSAGSAEDAMEVSLLARSASPDSSRSQTEDSRTRFINECQSAA